VLSFEPVVSIVVLNWRRAETTLRCLDAIDRLTYANRSLVVVDNGSRDGSEELFRSARGDDAVIQSGSNLGYAGGNNVGIRRSLDAGAEYVWILNNDTLVEPETLTELVRAAGRHASAGAIASRLVELDSGLTTSDAFRLQGGTMIPVVCEGCAEGWHPADIVGGPTLLLRADALREVGLFDEDYFHYYEEADLMERIRRGGWHLGLACGAVTRHSGGSSLSYASAQSQYYALRNTLLYRRKLHGEHPLRFLVRHPRVVRNALGLRRALQRRDPRPTRAAALAIADAVRNRTGPRDLGGRYQVALDGFVTFAPVDTPFAP
jgi:GT2 family glycosyltransferase